MNSTFNSIRFSNIDFLNITDCLYTLDFRATGEELDKNIAAMFKYENIIEWLGPHTDTKRHIAANELLYGAYSDQYILHIAPRILHKSHKSIYSRLVRRPEGVTSLWVGVPHPDADSFAQKYSLSINYDYPTFLKRNDKIAQKKLFKDLSPPWQRYKTHDQLMTAINNSPDSYLKKQIGAGGFRVIKLASVKPEKLRKILAKTRADEWYIESAALGQPWSIQCLKNNNGNITIFGLTKQKITNDTIYIGSDIYDISLISDDVRRQLTDALNRVEPLLKDYVGFFGIDYMLHHKSITVLECNIRLTAATIPTLLRNEQEPKTIASYTEDQESSRDTVIAHDDIHHTYDVLSFAN